MATDKANSSSTRRRLRFFRGRGKYKDKVETQEKECLNENILTVGALQEERYGARGAQERAPENEPERARGASDDGVKSKRTTKLNRPFQFLRKKKGSASVDDNDTFMVDTYPTNGTADNQQDEGKVGGVFGMCGHAAADVMTRPAPSQEKEEHVQDLQNHLLELQNSCERMNDELDRAHAEKEDATRLINKMIHLSKARASFDMEESLQEVKMILTADGGETTFSHSTVTRPCAMRFCCGADIY
ncbi:hypothetical protein ACHAWF_017102 [Thalassiosira exigua]